jgi:hypothetical protein
MKVKRDNLRHIERSTQAELYSAENLAHQDLPYGHVLVHAFRYGFFILPRYLSTVSKWGH